MQHSQFNTTVQGLLSYRSKKKNNRRFQNMIIMNNDLDYLDLIWNVYQKNNDINCHRQSSWHLWRFDNFESQMITRWPLTHMYDHSHYVKSTIIHGSRGIHLETTMHMVNKQGSMTPMTFNHFPVGSHVTRTMIMAGLSAFRVPTHCFLHL